MDFETIFIIGLAVLLVAGFVFGIVFLAQHADELEPVERAEEPHLYWKTIEAEVVSVSKKHWYASTHRYVLEVTVYSKEYNLTTTLTETGSGMFAPSHWNIQEGR